MKTPGITLLLLAVLGVWACGGSPVGVSSIDDGPDPFTPPSMQSSSGNSSLVSTGSQNEPSGCPAQIELVFGACSPGSGESGESAHAVIGGSCFTPNAEVGLIMSPNLNGWVKGGTLCNGTVFEIGEPFILPPVWVRADANGNIIEGISGFECNVEAIDMKSCDTSNALILPPV